MIRAATTFISLLFICLACNPAKKQTDTAHKKLKPNIIYIVADDLGYGDLSCYGQQKFDTPNIDRLAAEGMRLMQHYAGSTVCAPSRSALMTGQHTGHTYVRGNRGMNQGQFPLPDTAFTLPELLKKAGYVTGAFGKWGLGFPGSEGDPLAQGFDEFFGYNSQTIAHNYYPWELWHNKEKIVLKENEGEKRGIYAPALIQEKALAFLEQNKDTAFFLFVPTVIPHAELTAPQAYMDRFLEEPAPGQASRIKSKFAPETPFHGIDDRQDPRFKVGGYGSQAYPHAAFAAMIKVLDDQVGQLVAKVKALGLEENTIIIFTSDNGPHREGGGDPDYFNSNGPFRGYKRDLYEGGIRVPMIACWPGKIRANSSSDHVSAFWDVMPTLADLAGAVKPEPIDGLSFAPTLLGQEGQQQHAYLYWEFHEQGRKQAVRLGNWKGIRVGLAQDPAAPLALYNLETDPGEKQDVAARHPEVVREILALMQQSHVEDPNWPFLAQEKQ